MVEGRTRDLAMFNLVIDSKLRGCDVVALKVEEIAPNSYTIDRATVRQRKTGRPVKFELTEQTRQAVDEYLRLDGLWWSSTPSSLRVRTSGQWRLSSDSKIRSGPYSGVSP